MAWGAETARKAASETAGQDGCAPLDGGTRPVL